MKAKIYSSIKARGEGLTRQEDLVFEKIVPDMNQNSVTVDSALKFQEVEGFGGAMTESSSWLLSQMPEALREEALDACFDQRQGNALNYARIHMNSCDFSLENYSCCETPDPSLKGFNIKRDRKWTIPMLKAAKRRSPTLRVLVSPWSPPAWMKTNGDMNNGGRLKPEFRQTWADFHCRFLESLEREGIEVWGLTVQNEPQAAQCFDSCLYTGEEERDFVRDFLGPTLEKTGFGHLKLMIYDHNRDHIYDRAQAVYSDPAAAKYVWGTAYHWYEGLFDSCTFSNLALVHDRYPDKKLFFSEGCCGGNSTHAGEWEAGERYAHAMLHDFNNHCVAWVDWNIVLDLATGGPRHVPNACGAPILYDRESERLVYQSSFHGIGHFSRFVKRGAKRLACASSKHALEAAAFENPNGETAVVVLNRTEERLEFCLKIDGQVAQLVAEPRSTMTLLAERQD